MRKVKYQKLVNIAKTLNQLNEVVAIDNSNHWLLQLKDIIAEAPKQGDQDFVDNDLPLMNKPTSKAPFDDKKFKGKNLFKRVHGIRKSCVAGSNTLEFVCPYDLAKMQAIEVVNAPSGCYANLKVFDTPTGTISTIPNYMLNQFAFETNVREEFHRQESQYDADLIKDLKVGIEIFLPTGSSAEIGVNLELNEVKS